VLSLAQSFFGGIMDKVSKAVAVWVVSTVKTPIKGFEEKRNPDGSFYTYKQQLLATYKQVYIIIMDLLIRGKSKQEIMHTLQLFG
jgi:hypothetical protein